MGFSSSIFIKSGKNCGTSNGTAGIFEKNSTKIVNFTKISNSNSLFVFLKRNSEPICGKVTIYKQKMRKLVIWCAEFLTNFFGFKWIRHRIYTCKRHWPPVEAIYWLPLHWINSEDLNSRKKLPNNHRTDQWFSLSCRLIRPLIRRYAGIRFVGPRQFHPCASYLILASNRAQLKSSPWNTKHGTILPKNTLCDEVRHTQKLEQNVWLITCTLQNEFFVRGKNTNGFENYGVKYLKQFESLEIS